MHYRRFEKERAGLISDSLNFLQPFSNLIYIKFYLMEELPYLLRFVSRYFFAQSNIVLISPVFE